MSTTLSTPVARNVTILGEVTPGGIIRGSYFYDGAQPEAGSFYRWYIDGLTFMESRVLDFSVTPEIAGKKLRFSVTPMSSNDEVGIETFSPEMPVLNGYQNITEEENRNSFISQRGNCNFYIPEPKDRMCITNSAALSLTDGTTQSVHVRGRADSAGEGGLKDQVQHLM